MSGKSIKISDQELSYIKELFLAFNIDNSMHSDHSTTFLLSNSTIESDEYGCAVRVNFSGYTEDREINSYFEDLRQNQINRFYTKNPTERSFYLNDFPFSTSGKQLYRSKDKCQIYIPIESREQLNRIVFNLKSRLAHRLAKDIEQNLEGESLGTDRGDYMMCSRFATHHIAMEFKERLCAHVQSYKNDLKDHDVAILSGNKVYIKDIFSHGFVRNMTERVAYGAGLALVNNEDSDHISMMMRSALSQVIYKTTGFEVVKYQSAVHILNDPKLGGIKHIVMLPIVSGECSNRYLNEDEAKKINEFFCKEFNLDVLNRVEDLVETQDLGLNDLEVEYLGLYGIDFYNNDIAYCVVSSIMEESFIQYKERHCELSVGEDLTDLNSLLTQLRVLEVEGGESCSYDYLHDCASHVRSCEEIIESDSGVFSKQVSTNTVLSGSTTDASLLKRKKISCTPSLESNESNMAIPSSYMSSGGSRIKETKSPDSEGSPSSKVSESRTSSGGSQKKNEPFQHR